MAGAYAEPNEAGGQSSNASKDAGLSEEGDKADSPSNDAGTALGESCRGYATRYWDCCKAHCAWSDNVPAGVEAVTSCSANDVPQENTTSAPSSCPSPSDGAAYTCTSMAPWAQSQTLAYGFAAVPATGDICGRCYELTFDGSSYNAGNDPGSAALLGKRMVVQAANIGHDVANGQFDILIPGGGVGLFDTCSSQWGTNDLGATYGGFLSECKSNLGFDTPHADLKNCLTAKCDAIFESGSSELRDGCEWFVNWFEVADNPALDYREVSCQRQLSQSLASTDAAYMTSRTAAATLLAAVAKRSEMHAIALGQTTTLYAATITVLAGG